MTLLYLISGTTRCEKGEGTHKHRQGGDTVGSQPEKPQKLRNQQHRLDTSRCEPAGTTLVPLTHQCDQSPAELGLSQAIPEPSSEMNARQPTFLLPQPPQARLLLLTPAQKSPTFCLLPSPPDVSRSRCCAENPGVPQGSAPWPLMLLLSQVVEFGTIPTKYRNKGINNAVQSHRHWGYF